MANFFGTYYCVITFSWSERKYVGESKVMKNRKGARCEDTPGNSSEVYKKGLREKVSKKLYFKA
ncbi:MULTISPECIES: hypothetical protein [unclassified Imperialibacter]|uniref:hypothetical protein n=1 Tax=unclassified Imperialibacter TaxID=2629706 RepID=UPI001259F419|nr:MULTISPECIES: hypothetical protein [unclassified Imperialibacter]CAD5267278.1 hypothetical protein IMPERIA89_340019 [Imperialibacter sp. 89]CAD5295660.1 hypothetical protein IMPERIA75_700019 [Imperialibacter sp. 75]VVT33571.1 hypothetical protein IMPR6_690019 [Imperialibacter sp. EC-SDR9]